MNEQIDYYQNKLKFEMDPADLFEALQSSQDVVVVDTRKKEGYDQEHIPGAINFPHRDMTEESTRSLDKSKLFVCYCDGIGCNASTRGALNMAKLGFKVKELIGGLQWWKFDGYATEGSNAAEGKAMSCYC